MGPAVLTALRFGTVFFSLSVCHFHERAGGGMGLRMAGRCYEAGASHAYVYDVE